MIIINFTFDYNGRYEIPDMTLCNPNKQEIALITDVKDLKLTLRFLNCSELSFTAYSEINGTKNQYFSKLEKNRLIHVNGFGYFVINDYEQDYENKIYSKNITAYSAEFLLNNKGINLTFVTTPTDSTKVYSKSYKFWDELDRYSSQPVSLLGNLLLIAPQWKVGYISSSLWNQYRSFSETSDGLYGFLNKTVSESCSALFVFDYENYQVNAYDTTEIVKKTDIIMTFDNLLKNAQIQELNNDVYTVLNVKGAENLSIARINPLGTKQIFKLDYYVGSLDEESDNYYQKYNDWIEDNDLKFKVLDWQKKVKELMENSDEEGSYGYLLEKQNELNKLKLAQDAKYNDAKTQNESAQMLLSNYLDNQDIKTDSKKTTKYNYYKKKQYAYEYNMNVYKAGGTLYDTKNEELFDSDSELGQPNGEIVYTTVPIPPQINTNYAIDAISSKIEEIEKSREEIVKTYGYEYYFTSEERTALEPFIREGEYQDSTFIITDSMNIPDYSDGDTYVETTNGIKQIKDLTDKDTIIDANYIARQLLESGYKKMETVSVPSFSFSIDAVNFFFLEKFKKFSGQMQFGAVINVELEEGEWVYPYFQEVVIDYENPDSFSLTFGNRFRMSNAEWTWDELHNSTTNAVSSVNSLLSSVSQPVTNGTIDRVTSYIKNTLIAANQSIQATVDNEFSFGGYGIRGRKKVDSTPNYNGYSGEQIWISNNKICFTNDGWNSAKMIFGKLSDGAYGVVADALIGNLIAGNNLVISNSNELGESTFYVDADGVKLTNSEILFQQSGTDAFIKMNIDDGIVANDGYEDLFNLNIKKGTLDIKANSLSITGKTVEQISQEVAGQEANKVLEDYANTVTGQLEDLQSQIDGQIQTWFYNYTPTNYNYPASDWTTTTEKNNHLGDLFYIVDNTSLGGQAYRWALVNGQYKWVLIEDTEVTKALQIASEAQDTADGKRRVFVTQPTPPYDVGDLWSQGPNGSLMVCKTSRSSGYYVSSDWQSSANYIDSSKAQDIAQGVVDSQTQADIFNKLTNNGQTQGIFMQGNRLYLNATYMNTGTLTAIRIQSLDGSSYWDLNGGDAVFNNDTIQINSTNFKLDKSGQVSATGSFSAQTSNYPSNGSSIATLSNADLSITMISGSGSTKKAVDIGSYSDSNSAMGQMIIYGAGVEQLKFQSRFQSGRLAVKDGNGSDAIVLSGDRTDYLGILVKEGMDVQGAHGLQVSKGISCQNLSAWGSKNRIVNTSYGWTKMASFETPQPSFADSGIGTCDENGSCVVCLDPRYAETISSYQEIKWLVTPNCQDNLWVEKFDTYAIIHGKPNTKFDWMCIGTQLGYEEYAEISADKPSSDVWKEEAVTSYIQDIQEEDNKKIEENSFILDEYKEDL